MFPEQTVLNIVASSDVFAARLAARERESQEEIELRLSRTVIALPKGLKVIALLKNGLSGKLFRALVRRFSR
ncbi:MAG: hypothetical protein AAGI36_18110 [Pseudomonadota bacterium]